MYKTNWKWPTVEDVCWYPEEDVKIIEAPKLLSNNNLFLFGNKKKKN